MFGRVKTAVYFIVKVFSNVGVLFIAVLAVLVAYSALSRYAFSKPVAVTGDLGGLLFFGICFISVVPVFVAGKHVRVSLVTQKLPRRAQDAVDAACSLVALFVLSIYIWVAIIFTYDSYLFDCHSVDAGIYLVPWMSLMPISMLGFAMVLLMFCVDKIRNIVGKDR